MTWVRLDDAFATNPKVFMLSDGAFRAYVMGLCYASQHLSDGFVPAGYVKTRAARELEAAGLWTQDGAGWWIHDFLEYNPSRAEVEEDRSRKQAAGAAGGRASARARAQRSAQAPAAPVLLEESNPDPTRPDPSPNAVGKGAPSAIPDNRPDHDQVNLAEKLADAWGQELAPPALQKLNNKHGRLAVTGALRSLHGFPPSEAIRKLYAYVDEIASQAVSA